MGREIRRVPPNWEHPKTENRYSGEMQYQPLYDESYPEAVARWLKQLSEWLVEYPTGLNEEGIAYWDWDGQPPHYDDHRPYWKPEEVTAFQVYETVSEGTPVSPVFQTVEDLRAWLISEWELSEVAADDFIGRGWSFSGVMGGGVMAFGVEAIEVMHKLFPPAPSDES